MKETAELHSSAAQQNLQNNLPGEGGEIQKEREKKNYLDPEFLNSGDVGDAHIQGSDFFCH